MRKSIDLKQIGIFLLIFPFLKPHSLEYLFPHLETLFDMGRLLCVVLIVLLWVSNEYRMSLPAVFLCLEIWIAAVTLLRNPERLVASVINGAALSALVLAVDYFSQNEPKLLLRALLMNFEWLIWVNFITVLLFRPQGMYSADEIHAYYFLGLPNSFMIFVMPACMAALLNLYNGMNRLRSLGLIAAGCPSSSPGAPRPWSASSRWLRYSCSAAGRSGRGCWPGSGHFLWQRIWPSPSFR